MLSCLSLVFHLFLVGSLSLEIPLLEFSFHLSLDESLSLEIYHRAHFTALLGCFLCVLFTFISQRD